MTNTRLQFKKMAVTTARLADSKKAESIFVYDLAGRSELADYVVLATVDSPAQLEAVDGEISIKLKKEGIYPLYRDGGQSKNWKVLDYGGLLIHIFEREARLRYSLDQVFESFKQVRWEIAAPARIKKPAVKKAVKKALKAVKKAPKVMGKKKTKKAK